MSSLHLRRRTRCRLCDHPELDRAVDVVATPPANNLVAAADLDRAEERYPLDVYVCRACGHAQLLDIVDPALLFSHYLYVSGTSPVFVEHLRRYARDVVQRFEVPTGSLIVEIGSNDGTLLRFFAEQGMRVVGVDPATNIAAEANASGVPTVNAFFTRDAAERIRAEHGPAAVIVANNVLAHIDDLSEVMAGVGTLLAADGLLVFEVGYLVDVAAGTLFDTIYHEHVSYHTVRPLRGFLERHGLQLVDVQRNDSQGGTIRNFVQRLGGPRPVAESVGELVALEERALGTHPLDGLRRLNDQIRAVRDELTSLLAEIRGRGERIAGYGAPAKATTLMFQFGLDRDVLDYIVDDNPRKQGLFTPGLHVPIVAADRLRDDPPHYLLILAWNFAESIIEKNRAFAEQGGKFIVPLPEVRVR
ncbi:MAG: class I SAM-dependent methyltransferase [Dehalococcoidia bacterium]